MTRQLALFFGLLALAGTVACAERGGGGALPSFVSAERAAAAPPTHAPCTIVSALKSPVSGTPKIATAFGQLMMNSSKVRYAYPGIALTYRAGRHVYAATRGRATYYTKLAGFGPAIVVRDGRTGPETLYAGFARSVLPAGRAIKVKAGQVIAVSGSSALIFEYSPSGGVTTAGTQANPCGTGSDNGAGGIITVVPQASPVYARLHSISVDGTPVPPGAYPSGSPDVATPQQLSVANVTVAHSIVPTVYERSNVTGQYYVVLCGNAVFATGNARYTAVFNYGSSDVLDTPSPMPSVVFFRDPGDQSASLTAPLPPTGQGCPGPAPANVYTTTQTFGNVGQTEYLWYWCSATPDTVTFSSNNTNVVTVTPSSLPAFPTSQPNWPPPSPNANIAATGPGSATVSVSDQNCNLNSTFTITVQTPPPAWPVPTPIANN